ncbi:MAG: hypothetical protein E7036_02870 [Opitutales bacterium]|nr:hypothetical protein [Opitutales bacterium]
MQNIVARLIFIAVSLFAIPLCCLAQKHNDYTKSASSFSRKYQSEESRFGGKKSQMQGSVVEKKSFFDSGKTSNFSGKESYWSNQKTSIDASNRAPNASKKFDVSEYKGDFNKWNRSDDKAKFINGDKNLSKVYKGKIDISKRNMQYQSFIDKYYGSLVDRSMEDFNKYYSRASSQDTTYVKRAGAELTGEEEEGFFDFLSSDTRIKRKAIKFTGVERKIDPKTMQKEKTPPPEQMQSSGMQKSASPAPTSTQLAPKSTQLKTKPSSDIKEVIIDAEQAKRYRFLKAPDEYRSKATIKVQVKE